MNNHEATSLIHPGARRASELSAVFWAADSHFFFVERAAPRPGEEYMESFEEIGEKKEGPLLARPASPG